MTATVNPVNESRNKDYDPPAGWAAGLICGTLIIIAFAISLLVAFGDKSAESPPIEKNSPAIGDR